MQSYIQKLVGKAYSRWGCLEEIDAFLNDNIGLLTQGMYTYNKKKKAESFFLFWH